MEYTSKTVRCNEPGLTQEQALGSLYAHYGDDIRVSSVKRRGDAWVVTFQQKIAEFPPSKDEEPKDDAPAEEPMDDAPAEDGPPSDDAPGDGEDAPDGPPSIDGPPSDGPGEEKKDSNAEILHLLHEIAQALGVGGGLADKLTPGAEDAPPAPPGPGGPPHGGGEGGPGPNALSPAKKPTKLRPGEVLPNQTPIGAPAFASTQAATMTVESDVVDPREYKASQAQADIESNFPGYKVEQMKFDRTASVYRALITIH